MMYEIDCEPEFDEGADEKRAAAKDSTYLFISFDS